MSNKITRKNLILCYHYVRRPKDEDPFPRILGTTVEEFIKHIETLRNRYRIITPKDIEEFYYSEECSIGNNEIGLLFTFDDGLSDHYLAAKILNHFGIKALFFIPTCITEDGLPANPTIIHYCLSKYGLASFLASLKNTAQNLGIDVLIPEYNHGDNVWEKISELKKTIKYYLDPADSRKILLRIYEETFHSDYPTAMEIMHLTESQIKEMLAMGHSIGSHTHSHISVASSTLSANEIEQEILNPKLLLEKRFGIKVNALSYPFGEPADCLVAQDLLKITSNYDLAFTVEEKINTADTSPLQLGRYMPTSKDTLSSVVQKLFRISTKN